MEIWVQAIAENYKMVGFLLFINQPINSLKKKKIQMTLPEMDETEVHLISFVKPSPRSGGWNSAGWTWERGLLDMPGAGGGRGLCGSRCGWKLGFL